MTLFDKKVFTGWYRDKACTAGPVTGLKILEELKERPVREAPYADGSLRQMGDAGKLKTQKGYPFFMLWYSPKHKEL